MPYEMFQDDLFERHMSGAIAEQQLNNPQLWQQDPDEIAQKYWPTRDTDVANFRLTLTDVAHRGRQAEDEILEADAIGMIAPQDAYKVEVIKERRQEESDRNTLEGIKSGKLKLPDAAVQQLNRNEEARVAIANSRDYSQSDKDKILGPGGSVYQSDTLNRRMATEVRPEFQSLTDESVLGNIYSKMSPELQKAYAGIIIRGSDGEPKVIRGASPDTSTQDAEANRQKSLAEAKLQSDALSKAAMDEAAARRDFAKKQLDHRMQYIRQRQESMGWTPEDIAKQQQDDAAELERQYNEDVKYFVANPDWREKEIAKAREEKAQQSQAKSQMEYVPMRVRGELGMNTIQSVPRVVTQEQFDAIPVGTVYVDEVGAVAKKSAPLWQQAASKYGMSAEESKKIPWTRNRYGIVEPDIKMLNARKMLAEETRKVNGGLTTAQIETQLGSLKRRVMTRDTQLQKELEAAVASKSMTIPKEVRRNWFGYRTDPVLKDEPITKEDIPSLKNEILYKEFAKDIRRIYGTSRDVTDEDIAAIIGSTEDHFQSIVKDAVESNESTQAAITQPVPAPPRPAPDFSGLPIVSSDADYAALPRGATFVDKNGRRFQKP